MERGSLERTALQAVDGAVKSEFAQRKAQELLHAAFSVRSVWPQLVFPPVSPSVQRFIQYLASRNTLFNLNNFLDKGALQGKRPPERLAEPRPFHR